MYRTYDSNAGLAPTIYRTTRQIREDMLQIKEKINNANQKLNLRSLLLDILSDEKILTEPHFWIPELAAVVREAQDAQDKLLLFHEELEELEDELKQTQWIMLN